MKKRVPMDQKFADYSSDRIIFICGIILSFFLLSFLIGCHPVQWLNDKMNWEDDHLGEEVLEKVIEHQTGAEIDLTPRSP